MLKHPLEIILALGAIEAAVLWAAASKRFARYFQFLPSVFWIYFLPMIVSTAGLIDPQAEVYSVITTNLLPASLILLLLSSDIKAILRLGRPALIMMFAGSLGIMLGMPLVFLLFKPWVGANVWSGFGALSASWIGGSANMIAVKEAIGTPEKVFTPMVIVDTIVPYLWMGILVSSVRFQERYDRWNRADKTILADLEKCRISAQTTRVKRLTVWSVAGILAIAFIGGVAAKFLAVQLPQIKDMISTYAWTIILVSLFGVSLSLTPARQLERHGASRIGYYLLYFVLTAIGARANFSHFSSTMLLILAGCVVILVHAGVLVAVGRMVKAPLFLIATASQANIGGVASAPVVAAVYQPGLASVGLLLAILGNIVGTYFGILISRICYGVSLW